MPAQLHRLGLAFMLAIVAAVVLGRGLAVGQVPQIDAGLKAKENVGVGFDLLQEATTTVRVRLNASHPWNIVKDGTSSRPVAKEGTVLWNLEEWTVVRHTWEGTNVTINPGHAVRFEGKLTRAGTEGGAPPAFQASIADLDMDGDMLHAHTEPHWPPTGGDLEDTREAAPGEAGGYILPVLYPGGAFPANAAGTEYKIIRVQIRPKWGGDQSLSRVGTLFFVTEPGMKLYEPNGGAAIPMLGGSYVTQAIDVPTEGLTRDYGILTNDGFALWGASGPTLSARFQWDESIRGSSNVWEYQARDDIRLRPISLKLSSANGGHELGNGLEGETGEQGSSVDDDKKLSEGAYLLVNWDDDDGTGQMNPDGSWTQLPVPDLEKTGHVENEDNLAKLTMHLSPYSSIGEIELEVTEGAYNIKLWTHGTKGEEIVLTDGKKTWDLADPTERANFIQRCENGIWIEGVKRSIAERDVEIVLRYKLSELVVSDTVKATVVMINLANAVYRDNQMGLQTDRGHAALVAYFDGPGHGASFRTALEHDSRFRIIEMDGPTGDRSLDTMTGPTQYGCFTNLLGPPWGEGIDYVARLRILAAAKSLVARADTIGYTASNAVRPADWNGRLDTITHLRCEGLVEVCYEMNGVDIWAKLRIPDNNTYHFDITDPGDAWTYNGVQTWVVGANNIRDNLEEHNEFLELMWEFTLMPATQCRQVVPEGAKTTFTMQNLCQPVGTPGGNP